MRDLTPEDWDTEKNARADVVRLLLDFKWHTTVEINQAAKGTEGTRRLRELRKPPFSYIIHREPCMGSRQWQYRLEPPPQK